MRIIHREIVGGFIFSSDAKLLLGKNIKGGVYQGYWVVPGGGINEGESQLEALAREMREEVGLNISDSEIEKIPGEQHDSAQKTLRDTGETVIVVMNFNNYKITLQTLASETDVTADDDFTRAKWFSAYELPSLTVSPPTSENLRKLGLIN